jgi:Cu/Ag efflux protein CusF
MAIRRCGRERINRMRMLIGAVAALAMTVSAALAAQGEGKIASIDRETLTITLEDGKSYKLPGEFDMTAISEGVEVYFAYDTVDGQNMITDLELSE